MASIRSLMAIGGVLVAAGAFAAWAQSPPAQPPMDAGPMPMHRHEGMMPMAGHAGAAGSATLPTAPGQDAFGAIQEIVHMLEADPGTDWSKVDLEALRQHLIDMNELTLKAAETPKVVDGGLEIAVIGEGRTLAAIQRMVPAWAATMNGHKGWTTKATALPNGESLTVTATDPGEIRHIRGLGFIGLMASGSHHQPHHLAMARGEFGHKH
ncbi:hypothetical protein [Enhydrobacter sp.]|jgi:hypothetical protein|uniref:hypothetical protein n=1 Tax=Enhydrobacter sp. TaxID=1894999 RepID=UPI002628342A|nr:hypothetical protein [Enhydrobacter sp.]WIM09241.1 MAG: hypothetical protein OJF58_000192 [Enhydrobacter sp.]